MSTYTDQDLAVTFDGDLILDGRGDLKLANSLESYKAASNFVLRTDYGDYAPDQNVGCNLGSYIGQLNTPKVHSSMEYSISKVLENEIFASSDVDITVVPFDVDEALAVINLAGYFLIDNEITYVQDERMAYSFPFIDATPTPLVI